MKRVIDSGRSTEEIVIQSKLDIGLELVLESNSSVNGDIYANTVNIGPNVEIFGNVYGRDLVEIGEGAIIHGSITSLSEIIGQKTFQAGSLLSPRIQFKDKIQINGDIITQEHLIIPSDSIVRGSIMTYYLSTGENVTIGPLDGLASIKANDASIGLNCRLNCILQTNYLDLLGPSKIKILIVTNDIELPTGMTIEALICKGNVITGDSLSIDEVYIEGSCTFGQNFDSDNFVTIKGDAYFAGDTNLRHLEVGGNCTFNGKVSCVGIKNNGSYSTLSIANNSSIFLILGSDCIVGSDNEITVFDAGSIQMGENNLVHRYIRSGSTVEIGNNCKFGSLTAYGSITLGSGCSSLEDESIQSEKGWIGWEEPLNIMGNEINENHYFEFGQGSLVSLITQRSLTDTLFSMTSTISELVNNEYLQKLKSKRGVNNLNNDRSFWNSDSILAKLGLKYDNADGQFDIQAPYTRYISALKEKIE